MPPDPSPAVFFGQTKHQSSGSGDRTPFLTTGASLVRRTFGLLAAPRVFSGESLPASASASAPARQHRKPIREPNLEQPERAGILTARPRAQASPGAIWGGEMVQ